MFELAQAEQEEIDRHLEQKIKVTENSKAEAERLALDATRLLSCTETRLDEYRDQGFFSRAWNAFTGKDKEIERANQQDLVEMQKYAWRYINLLSERDALLSHSLITVRNNLVTLQSSQAETRKQFINLAEKVQSRFLDLEDRTEQIETSVNIHNWLITLETREYEERFSPYFRLIKLVNDFYSIKPDDWHIQELRCLQQAIKRVELPWKESVSLNQFVEGLIEEIDCHGYDQYEDLILPPSHEHIKPDCVVDNIPVPAYSSLFNIAANYFHSLDTIKALASHLEISESEAIKKTLRQFIEKQGVNLDAEIELRDLAVELLDCMRLTAYICGEEGGARNYELESETEASDEAESGKIEAEVGDAGNREREDYHVEGIEQRGQVDHDRSEEVISEFLHIQEGETKKIEDSDVYIRSHVQCNGTLIFDKCRLFYGDEEAEYSVDLNPGAILKINSCAVYYGGKTESYLVKVKEGKVDISNSTFYEIKRFVDAEDTMINMEMSNFQKCGEFIEPSGETEISIESCKIGATSEKFIDDCSASLSVNRTEVEFTRITDIIMPESFGSRALFGRCNSAKITESKIYGPEINENYTEDLNNDLENKLGYRDERSEEINKIPSLYGVKGIVSLLLMLNERKISESATFMNCTFENIGPVGGDKTKAYNCLFRRCFGAFNVIREGIEAVNCVFEECTRVVEDGENSLISSCAFYECHGEIISSDRMGGGITIEDCTFVNASFDEEITNKKALLQLKWVNKGANKIKNCIFDGVCINGGYLIKCDYHDKKINNTLEIENTVFQNVRTNDSDGCIIKSEGKISKTFGKDFVRDFAVIRDCKGLENVNKESDRKNNVEPVRETKDGERIGCSW